MKLKLTVLIAVSMLGIQLQAQDMDMSLLFQRANDCFDMGHFDQVEELLADNVDNLDENDRLRAYRLLALSSLYSDNPQKAEKYAEQLLRLDPFYTAYGDTPRFTDMLAKLKKGSSTVTTASKMAESVEEVPVPVTLITEEMIRASGAVKLQDVLRLYVPGLSEISSLEDNVAMRGVWGLGQETILVMLDGHRLNSQSTNSESLDFRNSVDKIKQIEVLRGPASSLYGNVALTAVVNIITKSGSDIDGGRIQAMGADGTYGASMSFGYGNLQSDVMGWASVYSSDGEAVMSGNTEHYVGAYNKKPSFDLGLKMRWDDLKAEIIGQHAHPVPYYNLLSLGEAFSYDEYGKVNGEGPGMARTNVRADIEWSHDWKNFSLSASVYGASERCQIYNVMGDDVPYQILEYLAGSMGISSVKTQGVRQIINWDDYSFGGTAAGSFHYEFPNGMNGSVMLGAQIEDLIVGDATLMIGADYVNTNNVRHSILLDGTERTISGFTQIKHYLSNTLIFNGGFRYDFKNRLDGRNLNTVSPRVSLIWQPNQVLTLKGGYSHAFVDAAAFYRGSTISIFSGGTALDPEKMDSYQAGAIFNWKNSGLRYELNAFFNSVKDMVFFNTVDMNSADPNRKSFENSGAIKMGGIENVVQYSSDRLLVNVNATYQHPFKVENFASAEGNVNNVPRFMANATVQYAVLAPKNGSRLSVRANAHCQSKFYSSTNDLLMLFLVGSSPTYEEDGNAVFGAGIEWKIGKSVNLSADVYNLSDRDYVIGGQLMKGIPGQGRSILFRASYDF